MGVVKTLNGSVRSVLRKIWEKTAISAMIVQMDMSVERKCFFPLLTRQGWESAGMKGQISTGIDYRDSIYRVIERWK